MYLTGEDIRVIRATERGEVLIELIGEMNSWARGEKLLNLEERLKVQADSALTVWLEPLNDRNAIRHFRGVKVLEHADLEQA